MKKILLVFIVALSLNGFAQQKELVWHTDVNKAINISNQSGKPLFLFFTGSDWCGPCKRLTSSVFKQPEFSKWATKNLVLVELDFNIATRKKIQAARAGQATLSKKEQEMIELQQTLNVRGYPTGWFVKAEKVNGKINLTQIDKLGYVNGGANAWINLASQIINK